MLDNLVEIEKDKIFDEVGILKVNGYRFVAASCEQVASTSERVGELFEISYHFDLNYEMRHLRIFTEAFGEIKSISSIYPAAFLIENEYQDLYGFEFTGLIIDYKGNLYLSKKAKKTPWVDNKQD